MWPKTYLNASAIFGLLVVLFAFGIDRTVAAEPRLALKGYDPVAYFTIGQPTKGNAKFEDTFEDVRYHFVSAKHLEMFGADPDKYAPRYRGLCAMGLGAKGYKVEANPENWVIHKNQLYLTQRSFGPRIFQKAPDRWTEAAHKHVQVLRDAPIGTGISWW
jgi:YHS domain-containing protein